MKILLNPWVLLALLAAACAGLMAAAGCQDPWDGLPHLGAAPSREQDTAPQPADEVRYVVSGGRLQVAQEEKKPQVLVQRIRRVKVTAYCPCARCCGGSADGVTAWGTDARFPGIAADRSVAFGTQLLVPGYGKALVDDRGSRVRGNHIDIRMRTHSQARSWGVRWLDVVEG